MANLRWVPIATYKIFSGRPFHFLFFLSSSLCKTTNSNHCQPALLLTYAAGNSDVCVKIDLRAIA